MVGTKLNVVADEDLDENDVAVESGDDEEHVTKD